ncbi:TIGR03618 family F420-dependent PPOX class oxidoreductase [Streptomyces sp. NPDC052179]|uniref:TIGR03618 family F420-dependent PPOX class oxidoreductase n=1 Tax=Streptomyces sp. NPDC052179 TaxID=3155680 RepID=UPI00343E1626
MLRHTPKAVAAKADTEAGTKAKAAAGAAPATGNATTTGAQAPAQDEAAPQGRPAPRVLTDSELSRLLGEQQFGVLAGVRSTGHPHLSTVLYRWDAGERVLRVSTTADRLKARRLRRNPRAALHVQGPDVWSFAVAEGEAEVSGATTMPGDAVGRELLSLTPGFEDRAEEAAFLEQVVEERRVVIRIKVSRLYGTALDIPAQDGEPDRRHGPGPDPDLGPEPGRQLDAIAPGWESDLPDGPDRSDVAAGPAGPDGPAGTLDADPKHRAEI